MAYMKGDLLPKTTRLVKGLAIKEPRWLKSMQMGPPAVFPRGDGKVKKISLPEDVYIKKFYEKHLESKYQDPIKLNSFHPTPARIFASRVLELKEHGVTEKEAIAVADMEYQAEKKAKKQAYVRLKQISSELGKKAPPNPYRSVIKEIQAEERPYVRERFFDPLILDMVNKNKRENDAEMLERFGPDTRVKQFNFVRQDGRGGGPGFGPSGGPGEQRPFWRQERSGGFRF